MENLCLHDRNEYPDDKVLKRHLGSAKVVWDSFHDFLREKHPLFSTEWRYYNDGKSWLCKVTKKKKTVFWLSVYAGMFKAAFYFSDKAEELITGSKLNKKYIDQFVNGQRFGKIRAVIVETKKPADLRAIKILIGIKEQLK